MKMERRDDLSTMWFGAALGKACEIVGFSALVASFV